MSGPQLTASAHCLGPGCTWDTAGDPETADKAAEKHTKGRLGHPTGTVVVPL